MLDITVVNDVILVGVYFSPAYSWMLYLTKPAYYSLSIVSVRPSSTPPLFFKRAASNKLGEVYHRQLDASSTLGSTVVGRNTGE